MNDTDYSGVFLRYTDAQLCTNTEALSIIGAHGSRPEGDSDEDSAEGSIGTHPPPGMILGENDRPAFEVTNSACLDYFFQVVPDIMRPELEKYIEAAWNEDCETALRLFFQTGNVREGGKMDPWNFYRCLEWLWEYKPDTLLDNIEEIAEHTCLKDLLRLLEFALYPGRLEELITAREEALEEKTVLRLPKMKYRRRAFRRERRQTTKERFAKKMGKELCDIWKERVEDGAECALVEAEQPVTQPRHVKMDWTPEFGGKTPGQALSQWEQFIQEEQAVRVAHFKQEKKEKKIAREQQQRTVSAKYTRLFESIVTIFADGIQREEYIMKETPGSLSAHYGKWAPTRRGACDKATGIVAALCQKMWPEEAVANEMEKDRILQGILLTDRYDPRATRLEIRYDQLLSTLRGVALVPEHFVGKRQFEKVDYDRMPSKCRQIFGEKVFAKHDSERYRKFLHDAETAALGKKEPGEKVKSVKVGALLPHEVTVRGWKAWRKIIRANDKKSGSWARGVLQGWGEDEEDDEDVDEEEQTEDAKMIDEDALEHAKMTNQVHPNHPTNLNLNIDSTINLAIRRQICSGVGYSKGARRPRLMEKAWAAGCPCVT